VKGTEEEDGFSSTERKEESYETFIDELAKQTPTGGG